MDITVDDEPAGGAGASFDDMGDSSGLPPSPVKFKTPAMGKWPLWTRSDSAWCCALDYDGSFGLKANVENDLISVLAAAESAPKLHKRKRRSGVRSGVRSGARSGVRSGVRSALSAGRQKKPIMRCSPTLLKAPFKQAYSSTQTSKVAEALPKEHRKAASYVAQFFYFTHLRQDLWVAKQRRPLDDRSSWTQDPILKEYWFCNTYRELDRGTTFFRRCMRLHRRAALAARTSSDCDHAPDALVDLQRCLWLAVCYRLVNKIETFQAWRDAFVTNKLAKKKRGRPRKQPPVKGPVTTSDAHGSALPSLSQWPLFRNFLGNEVSCGKRIFTSAHKVIGFTRYVSTMETLREDLPNFAARIAAAALRRDGGSVHDPTAAWVVNLRAVYEELRSLHNIGTFFAWQILCDLMEERAFRALGLTVDENTWCMLGPGAQKGLGCAFGRKAPFPESEDAQLTRAKVLVDVQDTAFGALKLPFHRFAGWPLTLKNIEHALCEFAKWVSNMAGGRHGRKWETRATLDVDTMCGHPCCKNPGPERDDVLLLCDLCGGARHTFCLSPPLTRIPDLEWRCPDCADAGPLKG